MKLTTRSLIKYRGEECLNCSTPLDAEDKYCHQCGQLNSTKKLALKDFFGEFFSNMFSYDSRIWRTVKHLLFKPGFVSKEYISGKRFSYANPFRFFLSVCIVFFLMVQSQELVKDYILDESLPKVTQGNLQEANINIGNGAFAIDLDDGETTPTISEEDLKEIEESSLAGKYVTDRIRETHNVIQETDSISTQKVESSRKTLEPFIQKDLDSLSMSMAFFKQMDYYQDYYKVYKIEDPTTALNRMGHNNTMYNRSFYEKMVLTQRIATNPDILADIILPKLPIFLFLLTPFLTLFLWFIYARRSFTYMEHLIFAFNVLTFIFLSFIILFLLKWITFGYINLAQFFFWFIGPFYLYKAMRNFYAQKRFKTIVKFLLVSFTFVLGLSIGISFLLLLGIIMH